MKVLYCIPGLAINADAPWVTRQRAGGMVTAGLEVTLLVRRESDRAYFRDLPCEILVEQPAAQGTERGVTRGSLRSFIWEPAVTQWRAFSVARNMGADLLYFSHPEPWTLLPAVWLRHRRRHSPAVSVFSTSVYRHLGDASMYPPATRIRGWLNQLATWCLCPRVNVLFDNQHVPQFFWRQDGVACNVLHDGYRAGLAGSSRVTSRQRLDLPPERRILLSFGVPSKAKGQDLLLEALRGLEPTFDVYLVGPVGGVYGDPRQMATDLLAGGWRGHLHFVARHVSDDEMSDYFCAADGVVLPYRHGFVSTSGNFRMAVEYGRAVVAADQFFIGEMVRRHQLGLLFPPGDVPALRAKLTAFGRQPAAWFEQIEQHCRALATQESWAVVGGRYRALFEQLLACRSAGSQPGPHGYPCGQSESRL